MLTQIENINSKLSKQPYISLAEAKLRIAPSTEGFYWIYTNLPIKKFEDSKAPVNPVHVHFSELAKTHGKLRNVIKQHDDEYWCIYNGKGAQLKNRIVAEFTNTDGKTGKLALLRCFKECDFKIKYIECSGSECHSSITSGYSELQRHLERVWRLNYGWPFLCRA